MPRHLVLRLDAPISSWGGPTMEKEHPTRQAPTRSALVGLLACCLGIPKSDRDRLMLLSDGIRLAVRTDRTMESLLRDFHILSPGTVYQDGGLRKTPCITLRDYLVGAAFTVVIEALPESPWTVDDLAKAVQEPVFSPFAGRRACPFAKPLYLGVADAPDYRSALIHYPAKETDRLSRLIHSEWKEEGSRTEIWFDVPTRTSAYQSRQVYVSRERDPAPEVSNGN